MAASTYRSQNGIFATQLAVVSFIVGTVFFFGGMFFPVNEAVMFLGFLFLVVAATYNLVMVVMLVYDFVTIPLQRNYYAAKIGIILCNIPVAFIYLYRFVGYPQLD
jgi:phospholipid N-methyltransferase